MTCRLLIRKCAKFNINSNSVVNVLCMKTAKWQGASVSSATFSAVATTPNSYARRKQTQLIKTERVQGTIPPAVLVENDSLLSADSSKYMIWQDSDHLRRVRWHLQQRCLYSTQPTGDTSGPAANTRVEDSNIHLSQREKLKRAVKEYGSTVIVFHITISLASLGGFYLAVSSGIDMVGILKSMGVGEAILQSKLATGTGTFVVAYAVHKVFAPVRIGITLTSTPFIVRYLRSKGILKPPKPKV